MTLADSQLFTRLRYITSLLNKSDINIRKSFLSCTAFILAPREQVQECVFDGKCSLQWKTMERYHYLHRHARSTSTATTASRPLVNKCPVPPRHREPSALTESNFRGQNAHRQTSRGRTAATLTEAAPYTLSSLPPSHNQPSTPPHPMTPESLP